MTIARRILAIVLALQVTSAWALPAGVLCVADDGHLALKVDASPCSHPGGHSHEAEHSHEHGDDHGDGHAHAHDHAHSTAASPADGHGCHPCVDVALVDEPPAQQTGSDAAEAPPLLVAVHPAAGAVIPAVQSIGRAAVVPPAPPPGLAALRTVVLTC